MTRYKITYSLKDETGYINASIVERDECSAKKMLRAMLKDEGKKLDGIAEITVEAENLPATKQQEREALAAIKAIIESLGESSYLATAFDGCFEDAENNIDDDAAYSMKDRWESAENNLAEAKSRIADLEEQVKARGEEIATLHQQIDNMAASTMNPDDLEDARQLAEVAADEAEEQANRAAKAIIAEADNPTGREFTNAVAEHRNYTKRAEYYRALAERIAETQKAGA